MGGVNEIKQTISKLYRFFEYSMQADGVKTYGAILSELYTNGISSLQKQVDAANMTIYDIPNISVYASGFGTFSQPSARTNGIAGAIGRESYFTGIDSNGNLYTNMIRLGSNPALKRFTCTPSKNNSEDLTNTIPSQGANFAVRIRVVLTNV